MSLVEVLVVIAILGILTGLILAGVQAVRTAAARADCQSRMRQLALAAHNYHAVHRRFPDGVAYPFAQGVPDARTKQAGVSWQTSLLPYLEQDALWQKAFAAHSANPSGNSLAHSAVAAESVRMFRCPTDPRDRGEYDWSSPENEGSLGWGLTNYLGVAGTALDADNGIFHPKFHTSTSDITDGTSNTIMIGERPSGRSGYGSSWYTGWGTLRYFEGQLMPVDEEWANVPVKGVSCPAWRTVFQPGKYDDPCHQHHFWSLHPGGANFAFADGSVKFLRYSAASVLPALATRAGGEVIPGDW